MVISIAGLDDKEPEQFVGLKDMVHKYSKQRLPFEIIAPIQAGMVHYLRSELPRHASDFNVHERGRAGVPADIMSPTEIGELWHRSRLNNGGESSTHLPPARLTNFEDPAACIPSRRPPFTALAGASACHIHTFKNEDSLLSVPIVF